MLEIGLKLMLLGMLASPMAAADTGTGIDPVEVQQAIAANPDFDVGSLWQHLAIPAQLDTVYGKIGIPARQLDATFDRCAGSCKAEIRRANLDTDPSGEVVLKVYQPWGFCRFLLFKRRGTILPARWQFLGHADHDFVRHYVPDYRMRTLGGKRYFVMNAEGVSGTGVSLEYDRWYEIGPSGLREILSLPAKGWDLPMGSLGREFESKVVARSDSAQEERFVVDFIVHYTGDADPDPPLALFARSQRALYTRPKGAASYALAPQRSSITMREIQTVFNVDSLSCADFLSFNADSLSKIALHRKTSIKNWLDGYAQQCNSNPRGR